MVDVDAKGKGGGLASEGLPEACSSPPTIAPVFTTRQKDGAHRVTWGLQRNTRAQTASCVPLCRSVGAQPPLGQPPCGKTAS